jgi:hypothetical protein
LTLLAVRADGHWVARAHSATAVHSVDGTRDSEFADIFYRTAVLETIGQMLVTDHGQFDMGLGVP